ncbi:MAG: hypothetical protein HQL07_16270 [Nitrospirae bacterium]|nr:hypothetical protein [Magnetococcales bacterium]
MLDPKFLQGRQSNPIQRSRIHIRLHYVGNMEQESWIWKIFGTLWFVRRLQYFRIVARVVADGMDVGEMLIGAGLAVSYDGRRKTGAWCDPNADLPAH